MSRSDYPGTFGYFWGGSQYPGKVRPAPYQTGLTLWLEGDSLAKTGSLVDSFVDKTSNHNDATAAGAARGTFTSSAINGKPGVTFDGATTVYTGADNVNTAGQDRTLIIVAKQTAADDSGGGIWQYRTGGPFLNYLLGSASVPYAVTDGISLSVGQAGSFPTGSHGYRWNEVSLSVSQFVDGVSTVYTPDGSPFQSDSGSDGYILGEYVGPGFFFTGIVCLVLAYDHVLSGAGLSQTQAYALSQYGVTV